MVPVTIINRAKTLAAQSTHRFRVGAVVYRGKKQWAGAWNEGTKTHPHSFHPYHTIHAEFGAILGAVAMEGVDFGANLKEYSIYVHRLKKDGSDGLAKPCEWCQKMLDQVGIAQIYYSQG